MEPPDRDTGRRRAILERIADAAGERAVLWRGAAFDGADVDVLVLPGGETPAAAALTAEGLAPRRGDPGHLVWSGDGVEIDVLAATGWPSFYPSLEGLVRRASGAGAPLPVASEPDRLLIFAAEAVAGRPLHRLAERAGRLLSAPSAGEELRAVAADERLECLGRLAERLAAGRVPARRGRLGYPRALAIALRCRAARGALAARAWSRLSARGTRDGGGPRAWTPARRRRAHRGALVVISGMDGAGKSTAARVIRDRLAAAGHEAEVTWSRFGQEDRVLDSIAGPVKRLLRRSGTIADPVAAGGPSVRKRQHPTHAAGRRSVLAWAWVCVVAAINASTLRRAARSRRGGTTVVCDRWVTDSLVDLELRYGPHPLAERILRRAAPRPDFGILLALDARTAAARKPGDQAVRVLEGMERLYPRRAAEDGLVPVSAGASREAVTATVAALIDGFVEREARRPPGGPNAKKAPRGRLP